ncbi:hypothetical protein AAC387_Pa10g1792 [Persea americana]
MSIAHTLGIDLFADFKRSAIEMKVSRALKNKRFLLIIEDVRESIDFDKIGVPAPSNGSKMVITSRSGQGPAYMVRLEEGNDDGELNKEEVVFEGGEKDQIVFPSLKRICLCGLPKLQSICLGSLPKLEELKVKGCSKLEKLPLCINENPNATPLKITGEKKWWANIKGGEEIKQSRIIFKSWHSYFL